MSPMYLSRSWWRHSTTVNFECWVDIIICIVSWFSYPLEVLWGYFPVCARCSQISAMRQLRWCILAVLWPWFNNRRCWLLLTCKDRQRFWGGLRFKEQRRGTGLFGMKKGFFPRWKKFWNPWVLFWILPKAGSGSRTWMHVVYVGASKESQWAFGEGSCG